MISVVDEHWPIDSHENSEGQRKRHPRNLIDLASKLTAVRIPSLPVPVGVLIYESFCLRGWRGGKGEREEEEKPRKKRKQRTEGNNEERRGKRKGSGKENKKE